MGEVLKSIKGTNGQLELQENRIVIKRSGFRNVLLHGLKGDKEILISQLSSIQFKRSGVFSAGYIQFGFLGGTESKGGLFNAVSDENTVTFDATTQNEFIEAKETIEKKMDESHSPGKGKDTSLDDLEKLAELKDKGIITEDEFNMKKKSILGL